MASPSSDLDTEEIPALANLNNLPIANSSPFSPSLAYILKAICFSAYSLNDTSIYFESLNLPYLALSIVNVCHPGGNMSVFSVVLTVNVRI